MHRSKWQGLTPPRGAVRVAGGIHELGQRPLPDSPLCSLSTGTFSFKLVAPWATQSSARPPPSVTRHLLGTLVLARNHHPH